MDTLPLVERLQAASTVLGEVIALARNLPESKEDAAVMAGCLVLVDSFLSELALNLVRGKEPYDAVLATARGATPLL